MRRIVVAPNNNTEAKLKIIFFTGSMSNEL